MDLTLISDLHGFLPELPGGDLLIVAGDLTVNDTLSQITRFKDWLLYNGTNLYKKIVMIAGNHDNWVKRQEFFNPDPKSWEHPFHSYLEDSGTEFEGLKIWGSPWTKTFEGINPHCKAFTVDTEEELAEKWSLIPDDIDILITHSPSYGMLDSNGKEYCGSLSLRNHKIFQSTSLKLHVCGHIHECGGLVQDVAKIIVVNASHVDERYEPVNKPIRIEL